MNKSIAEINNNPCNIRYKKSNNWKGQAGEDKGFCKFVNPAFGFRAFFGLAYHYYYYDDISTIDDFIKKYAPSSENNTKQYINYLKSKFKENILPDFNIYDFWVDFAFYVSFYESGIEWNKKYIYLGFIKFYIDYKC